MAEAYVEIEVEPITMPECDQCGDGVAIYSIRALVWLDGLGAAAERKVCGACRVRVERELRAMSDLTMADESERKP